MPYMGIKMQFNDSYRQVYMTESFCLVCVSPATAVEGSSYVLPMCVMQFAGYMVTVTMSHLMIRGLTSMDSVNTLYYR